MKYMCLEDIILFDNTIAYKYDIVELDQILSSGQISVCLDAKFLQTNDKLFKKIENVNITSKEYNPDKEDVEKDWILEIRIKTTRKKLRDIEAFIIKEIEELL